MVVKPNGMFLFNQVNSAYTININLLFFAAGKQTAVFYGKLFEKAYKVIKEGFVLLATVVTDFLTVGYCLFAF